MIYKVETYQDGKMLRENEYDASNSCEALKAARADHPEDRNCILVCEYAGAGEDR